MADKLLNKKDYPITTKVLNEYGVEMVAKMVTILKSENHSQHLYKEFNQDVINDIKGVTLEIKAPEEMYYASEGRAAGRFPPLKSIEDWVESRGLDLALAYPIARKIATLGTKQNASHFLAEFQITKLFEDKILSAYKNDIATLLEDTFKNLNAE